jgi:hypothetical protein
MFIDTTFTSPVKVRTNIYQSIKIVAIKFCAYVDELDKFVGRRKTPQSFLLGIQSIFIKGVVNDIISYTVTLVKSRCQSFSTAYPDLKAFCDVPDTEIIWICIQAFLRTLFSNRYSWVTKILARRLDTTINLEKCLVDLYCL